MNRDIEKGKEAAMTWTPPRQQSAELNDAMQRLRTHCSKLAFVLRISILSLDDDHLRLRSRLAERIGLALLKNPSTLFNWKKPWQQSMEFSVSLTLQMWMI